MLKTTLSSGTQQWQSTPSPFCALNDWLFDQGSLTQRLKLLCRNNFNVQPLSQGWQTLTADECQALGISQASTGWVREVFLCDGEQPWVFARSVASQAQLQQAGFDLSQLGSRSLGELLFHNQAFSRGAMYVCQLPCEQLPEPAQQQVRPYPLLWARRSCFSKDGLDLLVAEVFLPKLWQDTDPKLLNTLKSTQC